MFTDAKVQNVKINGRVHILIRTMGKVDIWANGKDENGFARDLSVLINVDNYSSIDRNIELPNGDGYVSAHLGVAVERLDGTYHLKKHYSLQ